MCQIRKVYAENDRNAMPQKGQNISQKSEIYVVKTITQLVK